MPTTETPIPEPKAGDRSGVFNVFGLGAVFLLGGLSLGWALVVQPLVGNFSAKKWVRTDCTILECSLDTRSDNDGTTFTIKVRYEYEFNGRRHESDRYNFEGVRTGGGAREKRAFVERHQAGVRTSCYVDPGNPDEATLDRDLPPGMLFGILPLALVLVGGGLIAGGLYARRVSRASSVEGELNARPTAAIPRTEASTIPNYDASGHPLERTTTSPLQRFCSMLFFTLCWNGIVSLFVAYAIEGFQKDDPNWILTIVLIPFVLFGVILISNVFHTFLAISTPRHLVRIGAGAVAMGGALPVEWEISGDVERISTLRVYLRGQENITCRQGASKRTETHDFAELDIAQVSDPRNLRSGHGEITIPLNAMHSVERKNHQIFWKIVFHGETRRGPDIFAEYRLVILPREAAL